MHQASAGMPQLPSPPQLSMPPQCNPATTSADLATGAAGHEQVPSPSNALGGEKSGTEIRPAVTAEAGWPQWKEPSPTAVSDPGVGKPVKTLSAEAQVSQEVESALDDKAKKALKDAVFRDEKWNNGLQQLRALNVTSTASVISLLLEGAQAFGLWHLTDDCLNSLSKHILGKPANVSPSLRIFLEKQPKTNESVAHPKSVNRMATINKRVDAYSKQKEHSLRDLLKIDTWKHMRDVEDWRSLFADYSYIKKVRWIIGTIIFVASIAYAIKVVAQMYKDAVKIFGWPIFFARAGGMGAACWTAVLYFTMSRGFLARMPAKSQIANIVDAHKELHIWAGKAMCVTAFLHVLAHCIGTVPGMLLHSKEELNALLGCANPQSTPDFLNVNLEFLRWGDCPLTSVPNTYLGVLFLTMPGLSGILLSVLLFVTAYTGRAQGRKTKFDLFWYVHNVTITSWPVLLFLHGSQAWLGVGFPLVVFTSSLPIILYATDRIKRAIRYYLFTGRAVRIVDVVIRAGKNGGADGAMTYIKIARPPHLWRSRTGSYAFLCMPEYAPLQWHPFTICSGAHDETVDFLIAGIGDWTRELARRCLEVEKEGDAKKLPKIAIDGPYSAPTESAVRRKVLVAIGAGVGITPFLSLMSTIVTKLDQDSSLRIKHVHFYWMSRSCDEFLFGRRYFTQVFANPNLSSRVFFHLHVTAQGKEKDAPCYLFREALKRQSEVDRKAFTDFVDGQDIQKYVDMKVSPELPLCWFGVAKQDVLWVDHLVETAETEKHIELKKSYTDHWASGLINTGASTASCEKWDASTDTVVAVGQDAESSQGSAPPVHGRLPIIFGRPDFATELRVIGHAHPENNIHVYICGNDAIVHNLNAVCHVCNDLAKQEAKDNNTPCKQKYQVHFERFG